MVMAVQVRQSRAFRTGSSKLPKAGVYDLQCAPTSYRASLWKDRTNLERVIAFHTPMNMLSTSLLGLSKFDLQIRRYADLEITRFQHCPFFRLAISRKYVFPHVKLDIIPVWSLLNSSQCSTTTTPYLTATSRQFGSQIYSRWLDRGFLVYLFRPESKYANGSKWNSV